MEFEKYGPLAQSKEMADNEKASWLALTLTLAATLLGGYALVLFTLEKMKERNVISR